MASTWEQRRFPRLQLSLPVEYQIHAPESDESLAGHGIMRDISLSGAYFHVPDDLPWQPGQLLSLSFSAPHPFLDPSGLTRLQATGHVVRLDAPATEGALYGVALTFLNPLSFASP
jgi:hypothetical protein